MLWPSWLVPLITTGASAAGNLIGAQKQSGAIDRAGQISQQATNDARDIILRLYDQGRGDLSPYANVGAPALNKLQSMAFGGQVPSPATVNTGQPTNALARGGGSPMGQQQAPMQQPIQNAAPAARNSLIGTGIGMGAAAAAGGLGIGGMTALGAMGGPIGMGLGAAGGLIASQFGKNNPSKVAATKGIDQVSVDMWGPNRDGNGGIAGAVKSGQMSPEQGKQAFEQAWGQWVQGMQQTPGMRPEVLQSSVASQKQYFQPVKDFFASFQGQQPPPRGAPRPSQPPPMSTQQQPMIPPNALTGRPNNYAPMGRY